MTEMNIQDDDKDETGDVRMVICQDRMATAMERAKVAVED